MSRRIEMTLALACASVSLLGVFLDNVWVILAASVFWVANRLRIKAAEQWSIRKTPTISVVMSPHMEQALSSLSGPADHAHEWEDVRLNDTGPLVNRFCTVLGCEIEDEAVKSRYALGDKAKAADAAILSGAWVQTSSGAWMRRLPDGTVEVSHDKKRPGSKKTRTIHTGDWNRQAQQQARSEARFRDHYGDDGGGPIIVDRTPVIISQQATDIRNQRRQMNRIRTALDYPSQEELALVAQQREHLRTLAEQNRLSDTVLSLLNEHADRTQRMIDSLSEAHEQPTVAGTEHPYVDECRYCGRPSVNVEAHQRSSHPEMF